MYEAPSEAKGAKNTLMKHEKKIHIDYIDRYGVDLGRTTGIYEIKAKKPHFRKRKGSIKPEPDGVSIENAKNRWEVQKILAAADRAKAHAIAEDLESPASQSISLNTFRSFKRFKEKKEKPPTRLHFGANVLVLHLNDETANKEKKKSKKKRRSRKINGWYVLGEDNRDETRSPMSWKDILEQSMRDPTMYSEYGRNPTAGIMPSRSHRKEAEEMLEHETSAEVMKEKLKNK